MTDALTCIVPGVLLLAAVYFIWLQTSPMQARRSNTRGEHSPYPEK